MQDLGATQGTNQWVVYGLTDKGWKVVEYKYHEFGTKKLHEDENVYLKYRLSDQWSLFERHAQYTDEIYRSPDKAKIDALIKQFGSYAELLREKGIL